MGVHTRRRAVLRCALVVLWLHPGTPPTGVCGYGSNKAHENKDGSNYNCPTPISLCENSVVEVSNIYWYCNSPYAFYWGNGAHHNSKICRNKDKVTFKVTFRVSDDIVEVNDIYVTMAVQDPSSQRILQSKAPSYLCKNMVGSECTVAGEYKFSVTLKLDSSSSIGDSSSSSAVEFCPILMLAFSTQDDSGYNLGALNMECDPWDNALAIWTQRQKVTPREWIRNYGMFLGTGFCLLAFSGFVWLQARRITTFSSCVDPCIMELDEYYNYRYPPEETLSVPETISTQNTNGNHSFSPPLQQSPTSERPEGPHSPMSAQSAVQAIP